MVSAPAPYKLEDWLATMHEWIRHPERNSSNIRRCEIWAEEGPHEDGHYTMQYRCLRRILPRRTQIDRGMLQECAIYTNANHALVVYTTLRASDQEAEKSDHGAIRTYCASDFPQKATDVPYYHPAVRCVAFHFFVKSEEDSTVCVDFIPFSPADQGASMDQDSRLGRTALSLLRLLHQHSYGHATSYVKRVVHDVLVPRDEYQDLYIALRTQYASTLIQTWSEVTDPKKHVFEDLGIAAYLMLLWKDMFPAPSPSEDPRRGNRWGQPPGGFVDIGCGNGLLVHILSQEVCAVVLTQGYLGYGLDARARKSWSHYAEHGARLSSALIDAPAIVRGQISLPDGAFLIGNHADELTPWLPIFASCTPSCSGFLNIPCCAWTLEGARFTPTQQRLDDDDVACLVLGHSSHVEAHIPSSPHSVPRSAEKLLASTLWFVQRLIRAPEEGVHSKHLAYYAYIAQLHMRSGWCFETEALRIPSTKNWALIGRCLVSATGIPGADIRSQQWNELARHSAQLQASAVPKADAHD